MTIKSMNQLLAQADATLPDNSTQEITPADVRTMIKDFIDSVTPAYGAMTLASQSLALSATPLKITPWASVLAAVAGYYNVNLTAGEITRLIAAAGLAGATDVILISGAVSGGNNNNVVLRLYKNGVPTAFLTSVTCSGAGDNQGFNLVGISYTDAVDAVYDLRASGPAGSYVFTDLTFIVQAIAVRSYV